LVLDISVLDVLDVELAGLRTSVVHNVASENETPRDGPLRG